jgi:hypothetical protein
MSSNPLRISQNSIDLDDLISDLHEASDAGSLALESDASLSAYQIGSHRQHQQPLKTQPAQTNQKKVAEPQTKHNNFMGTK